MSADVIVCGAGPAGCMAALTFAAQGARVRVLEAAADPPPGLAGEWLHPPAVRAMQAVGVDFAGLAHGTAHGFMVHPHDGSSPIPLSYPDSGVAISCEHSALVSWLRKAIVDHPNATLISGVRVRGVDRATVHFVDVEGVQCTLTAPLIIGADGKASRVRRSLARPAPLRVSSRMAGLLVHDGDLPDERFGHVVLGGPGPILIYRLGPGLLRVSFDIPLGVAQSTIRSLYLPLLPEPLRGQVTAALARERLRWAANSVMPKSFFGYQGIALIGDAVAVVHPVGAAGMTLGVADASSLAARGNGRAHQATRAQAWRTAGLLADGLHNAFSRPDPLSAQLRCSVYQAWRSRPAFRDDTMALLSTAEPRRSRFYFAFLGVFAHALRRHGRLGGVWQWARWLIASIAQ